MKLNESNPHCDCGSTKALFHTEMAYRYFSPVNSSGHFAVTICFFPLLLIASVTCILPCHCCFVCPVPLFVSFRCSLLCCDLLFCYFLAFTLTNVPSCINDFYPLSFVTTLCIVFNIEDVVNCCSHWLTSSLVVTLHTDNFT